MNYPSVILTTQMISDVKQYNEVGGLINKLGDNAFAEQSNPIYLG